MITEDEALEFVVSTLQCEDCQETKPDVKERDCPYAYDMAEEIVKVIICDDCCTQRTMSV